MTISLANVLGTYLFLLVVGHFLCDWLPQGHETALKKATHWPTRLGHCAFYTCLMLIYIKYLWGPQRFYWLLCSLTGGWLFLSHFFIDTYLPTYWWMRYVRRPPSVVANGREGFKEYAQTPLGLLLIVVVDQLWHILALVPVVVVLHVWAEFYVPLP